MKLKLFFFLFLSSYLLSLISATSVVAGNNITITCSAADTCTNSSSLPIFNESNIYPGYITSPAPVLTVINQRSNDECNLTFSASNLTGSSALLSKISLSITSFGNVDYAGNISSLLDGKSRSLGVISPSSTREYTWTTSFDQDAQDDLQNTLAKFNLDFNFSCDLPPTPTLPAKATATAGPTNSGSVLGAASAPIPSEVVADTCQQSILPFLASLTIFFFSSFIYFKLRFPKILFFIALGLLGLIFFWPSCLF